MSNLTFDHRLLKEHTPDPLEGHAVVVFERVGEAGDELHSVLLPGGAPVRPGLPLPFRKRPEYFAYAVDTSPERHLDFSESMRLADHVSEFRVVFNLAYAVADARALARARNTDPLRKVRDQVRVVITREVERLPWQAVWEAFPQHGAAVVNDCMEQLRAFASTYGIALRSLRLTVRLPEAIESLHQEERLTKARRERDQRVTNHDRVLDMQNAELTQTAGMVDGSSRLKAALTDRMVAAAEQGDLGTVDDLITRLSTLHPESGAGIGFGTGYGPAFGAVPGSGRALEGGSTTALPGAPANGARLLSSGGGSKGLGEVLADVLAATGAVRVRAQKHALQSALLHVVAELLVDDLGDSTATVRYAERARAAIKALDPSPGGGELETLKELANPEIVRDRVP